MFCGAKPFYSPAPGRDDFSCGAKRSFPPAPGQHHFSCSANHIFLRRRHVPTGAKRLFPPAPGRRHLDVSIDCATMVEEPCIPRRFHSNVVDSRAHPSCYQIIPLTLQTSTNTQLPDHSCTNHRHRRHPAGITFPLVQSAFSHQHPAAMIFCRSVLWCQTFLLTGTRPR